MGIARNPIRVSAAAHGSGTGDRGQRLGCVSAAAYGSATGGRGAAARPCIRRCLRISYGRAGGSGSAVYPPLPTDQLRAGGGQRLGRVSAAARQSDIRPSGAAAARAGQAKATAIRSERPSATRSKDSPPSLEYHSSPLAV